MTTSCRYASNTEATTLVRTTCTIIYKLSETKMVTLIKINVRTQLTVSPAMKSKPKGSEQVTNFASMPPRTAQHRTRVCVFLIQATAR